MNSATPTQTSGTSISSSKTSPGPVPSSVTPGGKEQSPQRVNSVDVVSEVSQEIEIPQEVKDAGVVHYSEKIEIPPAVSKLGVSPSGSSTPVQIPQPPKVVLPITDDQVIAGLHSDNTTAWKWLSVWCVKQLQKAHIALKIIHGKIVRVIIG